MLVVNRLPLLLAAPLFCVPFLAYAHSEPLISFQHEWLAAACGLLLLPAMLIGRRSGTLAIPTPVALPGLLIVLLLMQLTLAMIVYPSQGRAAMLCLMLAAWIMIAVRDLGHRYGVDRLAVVIAWSLLAGGALEGIAAVFQYWNIHSPLDPFIDAKAGAVAFGNLAQANHFADYQAMSLAALGFLTATRRLPVAAGLALGAWLLLGLALSGSRSGWLYVSVLVVLAYAFRRKQPDATHRRLVWFSLLALAGFILCQIVLGSLHGASVTAGGRVIANVGSPFASRLPMWSSALAMFAQAPLLGVGFQNYSWQFFLNGVGPSNSPTNAHNLVLHMLAEFGVGGGVFALLLGYWLVRAWIDRGGPEHWLILAAVTILLVHSMLEFPLHYLHFMFPGAALLALARDDGRAIQVSGRLMYPLTALLFVAGTAILIAAADSYQQLGRAYADFTTGGTVLDDARRARLLQVQTSGLFEPEAENLLNSLRVGRQNQDLLPALLEVSSRQARQKAGMSRVFRYVLLLGMSDDVAAANRLLTRAAQAYPGGLSEFADKLDELRRELPNHRGLAALADHLDLLDEEAGRRAAAVDHS